MDYQPNGTLGKGQPWVHVLVISFLSLDIARRVFDAGIIVSLLLPSAYKNLQVEGCYETEAKAFKKAVEILVSYKLLSWLCMLFLRFFKACVIVGNINIAPSRHGTPPPRQSASSRRTLPTTNIFMRLCYVTYGNGYLPLVPSRIVSVAWRFVNSTSRIFLLCPVFGDEESINGRQLGL